VPSVHGLFKLFPRYIVEINLFHDDFHTIPWNIFLKGLICLTLIFIWNA
jgi:hypothetical protein